MKTALHLLRLNAYPIFKQLQIEEALLRADDRNWCILNEGSTPAIVMGISGKPGLLIHSLKMDGNPVPLIRRFSGGGTVFIDPDTCFSTFICNRDHLNIPGYPAKIHAWAEGIYSELFSGMDFCLKENDYIIENRKFGGNAQYIRKDRWLHHTSFLWDFALENMDYLLMPPKMPAYRQKRSHNDFLCRMKDFFPAREVFEERLLSVLAQQFKLIDTSIEDIKEILAKPHRKATEQINHVVRT